MRAVVLFFSMVALAMPACAARPVTAAQLEESLAAAQGKPDAEVAELLSDVKLTERLSVAALARLEAGLPGDKARQGLIVVADASAFLQPPGEEIAANPSPDAATLRAMMVKLVNYVNTTVRELPNFIATRKTTAFEDRPAEDRLEATGLVSYSYQPLHAVGSTAMRVTYRDRREVVDESAGKTEKHGNQGVGLVTSGEFGPMMSRVVADAIQGRITWSRWEKGESGNVAVFHYAVPEEKSHYKVEFCCVTDEVDMAGAHEDRHVFSQTASYHGEIAFDPEKGSISRITMEAEMPTGELVSSAAMAVDYGPVEIGGTRYICPARSVSILQAHTAQATGMYSRANYQGASKTFLNHVEFGQYQRFGAEVRILPSN